MADFHQHARRWLLMPTPDSLMALAIFLDAHTVCGDAALLDAVRDAVDPALLGTLDRDLVRDALAVVKRFKGLLRQRFHLDAM